MKNILPIVLVFHMGRLVAQNASDLPANSAPFNMGGQVVKAFDNRYEGVRGSYTIMDEFTAGTVILKNGVLRDVLLNYDAYTDNLLAKRGKDVYELRKNLVEQFTLNLPSGEALIFIAELIDGERLFLIKLSEDPLLYCKAEKILKRANIGGAYNTSDQSYDEFIDKKVFYTKRGEEWIKVKDSKKGLVTAFPQYETKITAYLKKEKVNFEDYIQLMTFLRLLKQ